MFSYVVSLNKAYGKTVYSRIASVDKNGGVINLLHLSRNYVS